MRLIRRPLAFRFVSGLFIVLLTTACQDSNPSIKRPNMTPLSERLKHSFEKTKAVCFGRFILDVPSSATVVYGPAFAPDDIIRYAGRGSELDARVAKKLAEIEADKRFASKRLFKDDKLIGTVGDGAANGQKITFGVASDIFYQLHSFMRIGADLYVQNTLADPKDNEQMRLDGWTLAQRLTVLKAAARNLRHREDEEIPNEPGLCLDGAFLADATPPITHEKVSVGVRLAEFPDVHLSIESNKMHQIIDSYLIETRLQRAEAQAASEGISGWYSRIRFFRRGPRQLGDWDGYEYLARVPAKEDQGPKHEFAFMYLGEPGNPLKPLFDIQLDTGVKGNAKGKTPPSLTDEEAVALWDKLLSSLRVRPVGVATKTSQAEPAPVPLGTPVMTGSVCPQTGWWQCVDQGPMRGGNRQRLIEGQPMPHAVLLGPRTPWQRLNGEQPSFRASTVWTLVAYDDSPQ